MMKTTKVIKQCQKCKLYMTCDDNATIHKMFNCNGPLEKINVSCEDMYVICDISDDMNFIQAMLELKEKDIIEYQLKMSQFRTQLSQQKSNQIASDNRNRCPHCRSTNIQSISGLDRYLSVHLWGLASDEIGKSFRCSKCGYTW